MGKPAERILSRNGGQRLDDCLLEGLAGASTYPSQTRFYFGKRLFNRREIRRVCGQEEEAAAASLNGFPDTHALRYENPSRPQTPGPGWAIGALAHARQRETLHSVRWLLTFFLRVHPSAALARLMEAVLTLRP